MKNRSDIAMAKFMEGYNCAQSVLYSFSGDLGIDEDTALKMACGFGAGMGRKEEVCGAVTGGVMVIGAKYGRGTRDDKTNTGLAYVKIRDLMDRFVGRQGSYICRTLLKGCELTTEEGQKQFKEQDLLNKTCKVCVKDAVDILETIISDQGD
jgi:C_GCAxxG_C_C family probable redox protein